MAAFSTLGLLALGLAAGAGGAVAAKKLGGNQNTQQPAQPLAPGPSSLSQPMPPAPLPAASMAQAAGAKQRKKAGGGSSLAQPIAPRSSTMPTSGAGKPRQLLGY